MLLSRFRKYYTTMLLGMIIVLGNCGNERKVSNEKKEGLSTRADEMSLSTLNMPMPPFSREQIEAVRKFDLRNIASERYPKGMKLDDLAAAYSPSSSHDWAVLAVAYAARLRDEDYKEIPEPASQAFMRTVSLNPAFAFADPIFFTYFGEGDLAKAPLFAEKDIIRARIEYKWSGYGDPVGFREFSGDVKYTIDIQQANTNPVISVTATPETLADSLNEDIDKGLIQALGPALVNLLPVDSQFGLLCCMDNYPDWVVELTFQDNIELRLVTNRSNFIRFGGPWQTKIAGQNYVHFSFSFTRAMADLLNALRLKPGQPLAMFCHPAIVFDIAFPPSELHSVK